MGLWVDVLELGKENSRNIEQECKTKQRRSILQLYFLLTEPPYAIIIYFMETKIRKVKELLYYPIQHMLYEK